LYIDVVIVLVAPSEQAPPVHEFVNSSAIRLSWTAPDKPNGVIEIYRLYRNSSLIANHSANGMRSGTISFSEN